MPLGKRRTITETTLKALRILRDHTAEQALHHFYGNTGMIATAFAREMWPDSPAWVVSYGGCSTDRGPVTGSGIVMSAGSYLRKLWIRKLLCMERHEGIKHWHLSASGTKALQEADQKKEGESPCRKKRKRKS